MLVHIRKDKACGVHVFSTVSFSFNIMATANSVLSAMGEVSLISIWMETVLYGMCCSLWMSIVAEHYCDVGLKYAP